MIVSSVRNNPYGLPTFTKIDADGKFEATAAGLFDFQYLLKLDTVNSGGEDEPSHTIESKSSNQEDQRTVVRKIISSGTLDRTTFDVSKFMLEKYEVQIQGNVEIKRKGSEKHLDEIQDVFAE